MIRKKLIFVLVFVLCANWMIAVSRRPLQSKHGMVASVQAIASQIGVDVMRKGGNAIDAAVAIALSLAVVWPEAGNIGGGGFMLIRKGDGTEEAIDYRERAPLAATRDMYLDRNGKVIENASTNGHKAVAVPGTIAGLDLALKRHGKLEWKDLIEPARKLADEGFPMTIEKTPRTEKRLNLFAETKRVFLHDGKFYERGELFRQPDLARTLARLQQQGPREFYEGETAKLIVAEMQKNGGILSPKDLAEYTPTIRKPLHGTYRGLEIITMPPPSSGGIALIEMLNMLESYDLAPHGYHSADHIHALIEVMKRAFADRATFLGDPDFVKVPVEKLTSKEYATALWKKIDLTKATPSSVVKPGSVNVSESPNTTHFCVVDSEGNMVANTYTLNDSFGSAVTVTGGGFLLNDEMDDFTSKPGVPNLYGLLQSEANAIAPRKRPLSSMTPTIVLKNGKPFFAVGSPGGPTIINTVLQVIMNVVDFGMNVQEAVDSPRVHHQWLPDEIYFEPFGLNPDTRAALESRGHKFAKKRFFEDTPYLGDAQVILIDSATGMRIGASDPRRGGETAGY
jgi:gamma-glutamyltranspeptidase / glutathione hydrolase